MADALSGLDGHRQPALMTGATTVLALITLFTVPTLYCLREERRLG